MPAEGVVHDGQGFFCAEFLDSLSFHLFGWQRARVISLACGPRDDGSSRQSPNEPQSRGTPPDPKQRITHPLPVCKMLCNNIYHKLPVTHPTYKAHPKSIRTCSHRLYNPLSLVSSPNVARHPTCHRPDDNLPPILQTAHPIPPIVRGHPKKFKWVSWVSYPNNTRLPPPSVSTSCTYLTTTGTPTSTLHTTRASSVHTTSFTELQHYHPYTAQPNQHDRG